MTMVIFLCPAGSRFFSCTSGVRRTEADNMRHTSAILSHSHAAGLRSAAAQARAGPAQDQYLELTTAVVPGSALFGLGERTGSAGLRLRRDGQPLALWARDCGAAFPDANLYAAWPYWLEVRPGARPCPGLGLGLRLLGPGSGGGGALGPARRQPAPPAVPVWRIGRRRARARRPPVRGSAPASAGGVMHGAPPPSGGRAHRRRRARAAPARGARPHARAAARRRAGGAAHGVLLLNSNGMDAVVTEDAVSLRALGGVLDLFVLLGPAPRDVLAQLAAAVGRPALPPFWSLGFHQSKCAAQPCRRPSPIHLRGSAAVPP
jgi:hypothetical protein